MRLLRRASTGSQRRRGGQAIIEYILLVAMIALVMAVIIRNTNQTIYQFWTGLTRQVSRGCANCSTQPGPSF